MEPVKWPFLTETNAKKETDGLKNVSKTIFKLFSGQMKPQSPLMVLIYGAEDGLKMGRILFCATNGNKEVVV